MSNEPTYIKRIRQLINHQRMTIQECAKQCEISPMTLSRILNNKVPLSDKILTRLADVLCVSPEYILGDTDMHYTSNQVSIEGKHIEYKKMEQLMLKLFEGADIHVEEYIKINSDLYCYSNFTELFVLDNPPQYETIDGTIVEIPASNNIYWNHSEMTAQIEQTFKLGGEVEHLYLLHGRDFDEVWLSSLNFKKYIDQLYTLLITDVKHLGHNFDYPSYSTPLPDKWDIIIQQRKAQYGINQEESE